MKQTLAFLLMGAPAGLCAQQSVPAAAPLAVLSAVKRAEKIEGLDPEHNIRVVRYRTNTGPVEALYCSGEHEPARVIDERNTDENIVYLRTSEGAYVVYHGTKQESLLPSDHEIWLELAVGTGDAEYRLALSCGR